MITDLSMMTVSAETSLRDVMRVIDTGGRQIALVVDDDNALVATTTDGDIRRGILRGLDLAAPVSEVMHRDPIVVRQGAGALEMQQLMRKHDINHVPVVDGNGQLVALAVRDATEVVAPRSTPVVLMAGGLGKRLRPLTEALPKPMLPIGEKPVLERIINRFHDQGFQRFTLSLNYHGPIIRDHFGDGHQLDVQISYVEETKRLGTAGALSLMAEKPQEPFLVMNGDILTTTSFGKLLDFHNDTGAAITICAREFTMQVPYGVLNTEGSRLVSMEEKPVHSHLVNAGIYVLSPLVFDFIRHNEPLDMPDLIDQIRAAGHRVSVLPVREYWIDIGRIEDLERARTEFEMMFGP